MVSNFSVQQNSAIVYNDSTYIRSVLQITLILSFWSINMGHLNKPLDKKNQNNQDIEDKICWKHNISNKKQLKRWRGKGNKGLEDSKRVLFISNRNLPLFLKNFLMKPLGQWRLTE